tara:strand:- start:33 stop:422 length:390 start_codon:yes stop_codon:yes gene_type:complete
MKTDICLLAIGGDCSAHGMGNIPDFIPIEREDVGLVRAYLTNELERQFLRVERRDYFRDYFDDAEKYQTLLAEHFRLGNELIERGVFHHKWHNRTQWMLWELLDGMPINVDAANACHKGAQNSVRMVAA